MGQGTTIQSDPRLATPVTLRFLDAPLKEILGEIAEKTGVEFPFAWSKDERVTILVDARPAAECLERIGEVLGLRWTVRPADSAIVGRQEQWKAREGDLEWAETATAAAARIRTLLGWIAASNGYRAARLAEREEADEMARLSRLRPPGWQDRRAELAAARDNRPTPSYGEFLAGRALAGLPKLPEIPFVAATHGAFERLPISVLEESLLAPELGGQKAVAAAVSIRQGANGPEAAWAVRLQDGSVLGFEGRPSPPQALIHAGESKGALESFRSRSAPLATLSAWAAKGHGLKKPIPEARYAGGRRSLADALAFLADTTGLPVVSDAYLWPVAWPPPAWEPSQVLSWFAQTETPGWRVSDEWLLVRHWRGWHHEASEPNPLQLRLAEEDPTLETLATLAAADSPFLDLRWRAGEVLTRFDPGPLRVGLYALKFWAALGPAHRAKALAGEPIPYAALAEVQRGAFDAAVAYAPNPADLLRAIPDPRFDRREIFRTELAFFLEQDRSEGRNRTILRFGYGTDASVAYVVEHSGR